VADALAERGRVVVRRAYADWSYFDQDRRMLTQQHVELIEIPQRMGAVRKNAADIKMAVDAVELSFERDYITTFVIASGDSDFTPLVDKLRSLNKIVIGVGLQASTSALLPPACDEFLFYERLEGVDLPRRSRGRGQGRGGGGGGARAPAAAAAGGPPAAPPHRLDVDSDEQLLESENLFEGHRVAVGDGVLRQPRHWGKLRNPFRPSWGEPYLQIARRMIGAAYRARAAAEGHEAVCVSHQLPIWTLRRFVEGRRLWHDPRKRQCSLASLTSLEFTGESLTAVHYRAPAGATAPRGTGA
jgi:hypothetical protein